MEKLKLHVVSAMVVLYFVVSVATAYTYSITNVEDYKYSSTYLGPEDLTPWGSLESNVVKNWLQKVGWTEEFYHANSSVTKSDFGTSNVGYEGLDGADFHFHTGHGYRNDLTGGTWLALWDYHPVLNPSSVIGPDDVADKWDLNNEWVFISACNVLSEPNRWGSALKYSHMILGFSTATYTSTTLVDEFFRAAIDWDWTITQAYYHATIEAYGGHEDTIKAVIVADTLEQYNNDHLWGQGYVAPDEYPDDDTVWYAEWTCSG